METPTRFDLNRALAGWRQELAAQPHLAPDDRRELETHLSDVIAELRQRGLNEEESFWLARRRVGQPHRIAEEFACEDPAKVWRERACWLATALFAMRLWSGLPLGLLESFRMRFFIAYNHNFYIPDWVLYYLPVLRTQSDVLFRNDIFTDLCCFLPLGLVVVLLARGRMGWLVSALQLVAQSRRRLAFAAAASFVFYYSWVAFTWLHHPRMLPGDTIYSDWQSHLRYFVIRREFAGAMISAMLLGLLVWLLPAERSAAKNAGGMATAGFGRVFNK